MRWIQNGKRRNADSAMIKIIHRFTGREIHAVIDYTSRLKPKKELLAEPNWRNPDFSANFSFVPR
jgi:hypothetical protein